MNQDPRQQGQEEAQIEKLFFEEDRAADPLGIEARKQEKRSWQKTRNRFATAATLVLSVLLFWMLFEDLVFFLGRSQPEPLGFAEDLELITLEHNHFVQIEGVARDMCIRADTFFGRYRFLYFMGSKLGSRIIVASPSKELEECLGAVDSKFEGRVVDLDKTQKYGRVLDYYQEQFPLAPRGGPFYVLEIDQRPWQDWWIPLAFCLILLIWGITLRVFIRRLRRQRRT